ncbi:MAG TPA: hypothetical protein VE965_04620, partial [Gammaproteobacteria bacterium]|nr:hypothetical protein [Gammaproteobacteria bacterium]
PPENDLDIKGHDRRLTLQSTGMEQHRAREIAPVDARIGLVKPRDRALLRGQTRRALIDTGP